MTTSRSRRSSESIALGCTFFDTALAYGNGKSEQLLGQRARAASRQDAAHRDEDPAEEPASGPRCRSIRSPTSSPPITSASPRRRACRTSGLQSVDLQQFHVWTDAWAEDDRWQRAVDDLKREGLIRGFGISVNRWAARVNVLKASRTGVVDSVQVVYNIFDQNPEDELFPKCRELGVAVIARVPFDEGSLDRHADART